MRNASVLKLLFFCWMFMCGTMAVAQPAVTAINLNQPSPTNVDTLSWSFIFNEPVTGVTTANFTTSGTGTIATIDNVAPAPGNVTWIVTVIGASGDGTLAVDLSNPVGIINGASQPLTGTYPGPAYVLDNTDPSVTTISLAGVSPTSASTLDFRVTFSEPVTNVTPANFSPAGSLSGTVTTASTTDGGLTWLVTVSGVTGSGTLGLDLTDTTGITDFAQNNLLSDFTGNNFYIVDQGGPDVLSITRLDPNPTSATTVRFLVTFDEPTTGASPSNFTVTGVGTTGIISSVDSEQTTAIVTVTLITGQGTLGIALTDPTGITDTFGTPMTTSFTGSEVYDVDRVPPIVTQILLPDPNPTNQPTVSFVVEFSEPVTGLTTASFTLVVTGSTAAAITQINPALTTNTVTTSVTVTVQISGTGTVALQVGGPGETATDIIGNPLSGPTISDPYYICGPTALPIQVFPPDGSQFCESPPYFSWTLDGVSSSPANTRWTTVTTLTPNAAIENRIDDDPAIVSDGRGNWVTVWTSTGVPTTDFEVYASRSSDNGVTWSNPVAVNSDFATDTGNDIRPELATDGNGNWVAAWMKNHRPTTGADWDIYYARSTDNGATWSPMQHLDPLATSDTDDDSFPSVAAGSNGTFLIGWSAGIGTNYFVKAARSTNSGASFITAGSIFPGHVHAGGGPSPLTRVATDKSGTWIVTSHSSNPVSGAVGGDYDIVIVRSGNDGQTWSSPTAINDDASSDTSNDQYPHLAANDLGHWLCAWTKTATANRSAIHTAVSTDGGFTWTREDSFGTSATTFNIVPFVASGGLGKWLVTWEDRLSGDWDLGYAETTDNALTWSQGYINTNSAADSQNDSQVQVASDGSSKWIAAWNANGSISTGGGPDPEIMRSTKPFAKSNVLDDVTTYIVTFDGGTTTIETTSTLIPSPYEFGPGLHTWTVSTRNACGDITFDTTPSSFTISAADLTTVSAIRTDGTVYDVLLTPDTIYIAGDFTKVLTADGAIITTAPYLAAIESGTTNTRPITAPNAAVHTMALDGTTLYIGGNFTEVGTDPASNKRSRLAAINTADGSLLSWRDSRGVNGLVRTLAVIGAHVYAGGDFTRINGYRFNFGETDTHNQARLAMFTKDPTTTGTFVAGVPNADASVYKIAPYRGDIMVAGAFSSFTTGTLPTSSTLRRGIAVIDSTDHSLTDFNLNPNLYIYDFESDGRTLYVAGSFTSIAGAERRNLAAFDLSATSPTLTSWSPTTDRAVSAIALDPSGNTLYAGGEFTIINGARRAYLAGISTVTGQVITCFYNADNFVKDIEASQPGLIYVGGSLTRTGVRAAPSR